MKRLVTRTVFWGPLACAPLVAMACSAAGEPGSGNPGESSASNVTTTATEGVATEITVATLPNTTCKLHPTGVVDVASSSDVYSDYRGVVHFYANRAAASDPNTRLSVDCEESPGHVTEHVVDLRDEATFHDAATPSAAVGAKARPGLSEVAANAMTPEQLNQAGFPPRPDREQTPDLYAQWLEILSTPTTYVTAVTVERADLHAGTEQIGTNSGWGGDILDQGPYSGVIANVPVPAIPVSPAGSAVLWAGLGGVNSDSALIQAGVQVTATGTVAQYNIFYEYWRNAGRFVTNVPVKPGDMVRTWMNPCDVNGNFTMTGAYGCFYLQNLTSGLSTSVSMATNSKNPPFKGLTAEFVLEPQAPYVPNIGTVVINGLVAAPLPDGGARSALFPGDNFMNWSLTDSSGAIRANVVGSAYNQTQITWVRGN